MSLLQNKATLPARGEMFHSYTTGQEVMAVRHVTGNVYKDLIGE